MQTKKRLIFFLLFGFLNAIPAHSTKYEDTQLWSSLAFEGSFPNEMYRYNIFTQSRFGNDISRVTTLIFRPSIGYQTTPFSSFWLGHDSFYLGYPVSTPSKQQQRFWQQYLYKNKFDDVSFVWRTRLEEKRDQGSEDYGIRLRQALLFKVPILYEQRLDFVLGNEVFLHLKNPINDKFDPLFNQNFLLIGTSFPINKSTLATVGYLRKYVNSLDSDPAFKANAGVVNFSFNLDK